VFVDEVCGLEWKHINFEEMTLEIEQQLIGIEEDNKNYTSNLDLKTKVW